MDNYRIVIPSIDDFVDYFGTKNRLTEFNQSILEAVALKSTIPFFGKITEDGKEKIICVGYAGINSNSKTVTIYECKTKEEYQGMGYFKTLLNYMLEKLSEKGYEKVYLGVDESNEKNQQMYEHFGYSRRVDENGEYVTSKWTYPDNHEETILWYEKSLKNINNIKL